MIIADFVWCMIFQRFRLHIVTQNWLRSHVKYWKRLLRIFGKLLLLHWGHRICWVWHYGRLAILPRLTEKRVQIIRRRMVQLLIQTIEIILLLHVLLHLEWIEVYKAIALIIFCLQTR